jgi:multicomponent Na+:H+ antiporter subunit G
VGEVVAEGFAVVGAVFVLLAGIGVLRFPDVYARMHAATKATTLGIAFVGLAAALTLAGERSKTLLAVAFIFITGPSAAHFVGRAAQRSEGIPIDLATTDDVESLLDDRQDEPGPAAS